MMTYTQRCLREMEPGLQFLLKYQIRDPESPDYGGYYSKDYGAVMQNCGSAGREWTCGRWRSCRSFCF